LNGPKKGPKEIPWPAHKYPA